MKKEYKVLLCYLLACVCYTLAKNPVASGNPHIPLADSMLFYLIVSPIYAPSSLSLSLLSIFLMESPSGVGDRIKDFAFGLLAFAVPLIVSLVLVLRRKSGVTSFIQEARDTRASLLNDRSNQRPKEQGSQQEPK